MKHSCPKCGSDQIQTAKMIWESGTATGVHSSTGVGVGLGSGGGLGVGLGGATTQSASMTTLASRVAPPTQRKVGCMVLAMIPFGAALTFGAFESGGELFFMGLVGAPLVVIGITLIVKTLKWNKEEFPKLHADWERQWLCHRCGDIFTPAQ
jgi:hypothetical protein